MVTLQNQTLHASISPNGAELQSLFNKGTNLQYMWNGDAAYWSKHSPVLFPIVGSLKNDTYYFEGKEYRLPRHGFGREKEFVANQISETEALFILQQDDETLKVYPFQFTLGISYLLSDNKITCSYEIYNPERKDLYFSVGAHPAFAVPIVNGTNYDDYFLLFNKTENLYRWKLENGLIANHSELLPTENGKLDLQKDLFFKDAIVLKNLQSNCISLGCSKSNHGLNFYFNDFNFFGIWAAKDAPFVCLEPWCGIADSVNSNQELKDKEGINILNFKENFTRKWSVECF